MLTQIENEAKQTKEDICYWTFTLKLVFENFGSVRETGWRYFPSTGTIAAPKRNVGNKRYVPTSWLSGFLYDQVAEDVPRFFISQGLCEEPWELSEKKKGKKK